MPDPIIKLEHVSYSYPRSKSRALNDINLTIPEGEFLAVMGANGSGKTSFCRLLNGIIPHSQGGVFRGAVMVDGENTRNTRVAALARKVGMVLDDPDAQLFAATVRDEAAFGPENLLLPVREVEERVRQTLETSGLWEYRDAPPSVLSGGQKQRLAIAAAVALGGKILVLDEPSSQLDPAGAREVFSLIGEIRRRERITVILATHDSEEAAQFAGRICVLKEGAVAACDTPSGIFGSRALLNECGIRPPDSAALAFFLREYGEDFPSTPVRQEEAVSAVKEWYFQMTGEDR